jgi:hypothetical protein
MSISSRMREVKASSISVPRSPAKAAAKENLFAEDGWIFREQPGKGVECIRRDDDAQTVGVTRTNPVQNRYRKN